MLDGHGGAGLLVFGEKAIPREDGADDLSIFTKDFIEQRAGADGAGATGLTG